MPAASSLASPLASPAADLPPRERILHAAHVLFYGEGIRATGIDKVIAEAQVSKVTDRKSTRLNSSHSQQSRMPSSA